MVCALADGALNDANKRPVDRAMASFLTTFSLMLMSRRSSLANLKLILDECLVHERSNLFGVVETGHALFKIFHDAVIRTTRACLASKGSMRSRLPRKRSEFKRDSAFSRHDFSRAVSNGHPENRGRSECRALGQQASNSSGILDLAFASSHSLQSAGFYACVAAIRKPAGPKTSGPRIKNRGRLGRRPLHLRRIALPTP